jgi:hypothetical protein
LQQETGKMDSKKQHEHGFFSKYHRDYYGGGLMLVLGLLAIWEGT